jgi:hypothetical protein
MKCSMLEHVPCHGASPADRDYPHGMMDDEPNITWRPINDPALRSPARMCKIGNQANIRYNWKQMSAATKRNDVSWLSKLKLYSCMFLPTRGNNTKTFASLKRSRNKHGVGYDSGLLHSFSGGTWFVSPLLPVIMTEKIIVFWDETPCNLWVFTNVSEELDASTLSWRWKQETYPKLSYISAKVHSVMNQKKVFFSHHHHNLTVYYDFRFTQRC